MVHPRFMAFGKLRGLRALELPARGRWLALCAGLILSTGCALAPRSQVDECHRLSRTLRSENARLKDQVLVLKAQNRDFADRAEDDSNRLAMQDEAIERLETSVRAYQDERVRSDGERLSHAASTVAAGKQKSKPGADRTDGAPEEGEKDGTRK
jgi:hypothetical protein